MTPLDGTRIQVSPHCELTVRGSDERHVLNRLTTWVHQHHHDIQIIALQWAIHWALDPDGIAQTDQLPEYVITMQFRTGPQRDPHWGQELIPAAAPGRKP